MTLSMRLRPLQMQATAGRRRRQPGAHRGGRRGARRRRRRGAARGAGTGAYRLWRRRRHRRAGRAGRRRGRRTRLQSHRCRRPASRSSPASPKRDGGAVYNSAVFVDGRPPRRPSTANRISTATMSGALLSAAAAERRRCFDFSRPEARHADLLRCRVPGKRPASGAGRRRRGARADRPAGRRACRLHRRQHDPGPRLREPGVRRLRQPCRRRRPLRLCRPLGIAAPDGSLLAEAPATGEALLLATIDRGAYRASALENTYLDDLQPHARPQSGVTRQTRLLRPARRPPPCCAP